MVMFMSTLLKFMFLDKDTDMEMDTDMNTPTDMDTSIDMYVIPGVEIDLGHRVQ
jgi:hypothetical protein